ncbi:MAG TPA: hypothetical protein VKB70_05805 [Gaiellaceae bacterium]|nr:hypothetical protein [Gaiellaceae bacterium]
MSFLDRLRKMLAGPPPTQGDDAGDAALRDEFGTSDEGPVGPRQSEKLTGGAAFPGAGLAAAAGSEAADAEIASEEEPSGS